MGIIIGVLSTIIIIWLGACFVGAYYLDKLRG